MSYVDFAKQTVIPPPDPGYMRISAKMGGLHLVNENSEEGGPTLFCPPNISTPLPLVIAATGIIEPTATYHTVDTENMDPSDDLRFISWPNTYPRFNLIILRPFHTDRTIVVKHNDGDIWLSKEADITLDDISKHIMLFWNKAFWVDFFSGV